MPIVYMQSIKVKLLKRIQSRGSSWCFSKNDFFPDFDKVAHAIANKSKWRIYPTGNTALNYFDLSAHDP
ncbi:MAG: hypothetical protein OCD01_10860 [Fibrobacterales bacterium]